MWDVDTGLQVFKLTSFQVDSQQPNYNYHHEEHEELQMEQLELTAISFTVIPLLDRGIQIKQPGCRYGFAGFQVDKFSG
jgi:hypothetical protein